MDFINHFFDNHANVFYFMAGVCLVVELMIIGLSGPLLFFAIASFITGVLVSLGLISGWEAELFVLGVLTTIVALLLWKPLKKFQADGEGKDTSSDMIGLSVRCAKSISTTGGAIRYSGVDWTARLDDAYNDIIDEGVMCEITGVEGNVMVVKPK